MKHNIRINGQEQELDCELGSGILDKNGREIFEGDKVNLDNDSWGYTIRFVNGAFFVGNERLIKACSSELEIVD